MRKASCLLLLALLAGSAAPKAKPLAGKKVLMVIAFRQFRDEEYKFPRQALEEAGAKVVVASTQTGVAVGMLGAKVRVTTTLPKVRAKDFDAVIFVGGVGAQALWRNPYALRLAREAAKGHKVVAAICIAPVILANAGVLEGRKATVWPSRETIHILKSKGAIYVGRPVVKSGNVITANGPKAAKAFAKEVVKALSARRKR